MQANRGRDTAPELALRSELHSRGLRYRVHVRPLNALRCQADIVFSKARVAIFVDGCWWHGCPEHLSLPGANREWWKAKIERNIARDRRNDIALTKAGWSVVRVWEHEPASAAANRIEALLAHASQ
jgi:DNA mismatch endonuclease (patch repair protein)